LPTAVIRILVLAASMSLVSCGGEGNEVAEKSSTNTSGSEPMEAVVERAASDREQTGTCAAPNFTVTFVQREDVSVTSGSDMLATASYSDREVSRSCPASKVPLQSSDTGLNEGVYRDLQLDCTVRGQITIDVHPVRDGDNEMAIAGSTLAIYAHSASKTEVAVVAVLKNYDDAKAASRLYYAPGHCKPA
jgi:hypothetical protein